MALKIRMRQQGRTNRQTYRVVVTDSRNPRDGKYIEMLGWYNPFLAEKNVSLHTERLEHWLGLGAELSDNVATLMTGAAPDVLKALRTKQRAKQEKRAAKRRALKKAHA